MPPAARMGDQTEHGGVITKGETTVLMSNMPAARMADMHTCPKVEPGPVPHVGGPIMPPCSTTVVINMLPAARVGDKAVCVGPPDTIVKGDNTIMIG